MFEFILLIGAVFSILAAVCSFLITYGEYLKHYPDKKRPLKLALKMAVASFFFFMLMVIVLGFVVSSKKF
jgi:nitric oxide reductase large subunit